jgi:putative tryptophan/tyrosine transport system substrate-binding protein
MPKRLELLSELVPQASVISLLVNPNNSNAERMIGDVQEAARTKRVQLYILKAGAEDEFETAFASLVELQTGALLVGDDPFFFSPAMSLWLLQRAMPFRRYTSGGNTSRSAG